MSNSCRSCGVSIPDGQRFCSMCYGDPSYGKDGYYAEYLRMQERQEEEEEERRYYEDQEYNKYMEEEYNKYMEEEYNKYMEEEYNKYIWRKGTDD